MRCALTLIDVIILGSVRRQVLALSRWSKILGLVGLKFLSFGRWAYTYSRPNGA